MEVLWVKGSGTVAEIVAAIPPPQLAYNTVLTMLTILERKRYVKHTAAGRAFVYRPAVARDDAAQSAIADLAGRFFKNNPGELALRLIERNPPSREEIARLRDLIDGYEERS